MMMDIEGFVKESFFVVKDDEVVIKGLGKKISNNHVQEIFLHIIQIHSLAICAAYLDDLLCMVFKIL
jgi:hypothetical protein